MKFVQLEAVEWRDNRGGKGYTLADDGNVYRSIPQRFNTQHRGWLKMDDTILPSDYKTVMPNTPHSDQDSTDRV